MATGKCLNDSSHGVTHSWHLQLLPDPWPQPHSESSQISGNNAVYLQPAFYPTKENGLSDHPCWPVVQLLTGQPPPVLPSSAPAREPQDCLSRLRIASVLSRLLPIHVSLGAAEPSATLPKPRATGCQARLGVADGGLGDSALRSAQLQPSDRHLRHPRSHPSHASPPAHVRGCHGQGCSLALRNPDWDPTPPPSWMETGLSAMRLGLKCIYAARNPNLQRENWFTAEKVCIKWSQFQLKLRSCRFDVNHLSLRLPFGANSLQSIMPSPPTQGRDIFTLSSSPFIKDCFQKRHLLSVLYSRARTSVTVFPLL